MRRSLKIAWAGALVAAVLAGPALAQGKRFPTGALPTPPERLRSIPATEIYRDFLPSAVDLSSYFPAVGDQGQQSSCVGWATAYAARAYYAKAVEGRQTSDASQIPSPSFIYNSILDVAGDCTQGTYLPDALALLETGDYSLAAFPYADDVCPRPSEAQAAGANDFRIADYQRVDTADLDQVKGELAKGNPVVVIAALDNSFFDIAGPQSVWRSDPARENIGGHALAIVGYDEGRGTFKFINSWGTGWGDNGYGQMDYATFQGRVLEAYVMRLPGDPDVVLDQASFIPAPDLPVIAPLRVEPSQGLAIDRDITLLADAQTPKINGLACGTVSVITDADGKKIATGFAGTQQELAAIAGQLGDSVDDNQVALRPWPQCEALLTVGPRLEAAEVPLVSVSSETPKNGDAFSIAMESPDFPAFIEAAYFSADGSVIRLDVLPLPGAPLPPHTRLVLGDGKDGRSGFTVGPPFGAEMVLVIASEKPLIDAPTPAEDTGRHYLTALRAALLAQPGDEKISASFVPLVTAP